MSSTHSPEPLVSTTPAPGYAGPKTVAIRLVSTHADERCRFWIGLTAKGANTPTSLLAETSIGALFHKAAQIGINETPPVLLTDTDLSPPRFVYLAPVPQDEFRARVMWTDALLQSLKSWTPTAIGFYFAPELITNNQLKELLDLMLQKIIADGTVQEIYLYVGSYGINTLLSSILRLKAELDSEKISINIYH